MSADTAAAIVILVVCIGLSVLWRGFCVMRIVTRMLKTPMKFEPFRQTHLPGLGGPSNPTGQVNIDVAMVRRLEPALADTLESLQGLEDSVSQSDGQGGVVLRSEPLLVAVYNDEFDAMLVYGFPAGVGTALGWPVGRKLACAMTYYSYGEGFERTDVMTDIHPGERDAGRWDNTGAIVIDTISADREAIERIKSGVPEADWLRLQQLAWGYLADPVAPIRDGRPSRVFIPAGSTLAWRCRRTWRWFLG